MPFINSGDLNVHYIENGTQGGLGTIVFVHGNWATSSWWEPVLASPLTKPWHGIAYDVRGRGRTTGPDSDYSIPSLAGDLGSFIDALGIEVPHLVGHSLGSAIVMQFALDHPAKVRSLTVAAPAWVERDAEPAWRRGETEEAERRRGGVLRGDVVAVPDHAHRGFLDTPPHGGPRAAVGSGAGQR